MKTKLALLALACGVTFAANAQSTADETLKPVAGNKTLEASLGWGGYSSTTLRLRKFSSDNVAFRYSVDASIDNDRLNDDGKATRFSVGFAPGVEKHFAGTSRLSPYIGFSTPISYSYKHLKGNGIEVINSLSTNPNSYDRGYLSFGVNGIAGVDFYIVKNFYVGIEAGVGADYRRIKEVKVKSNDNAAQNYTLEGYDNFNFSTFSTGGLRVGFAF
ncbi:hypothetical protein MKJ04_03420 [Pontibacter sp. E15-1]|uniref:hypothetical protein n=1 Tax=Pontibacter sp. E15-1 TaxID=2919918 RepID=UPI001F4FD664|nr:hypothetical protein [Pontibacter sp. E15-1]MCJ8163876.1 hypothetical protein [Pontibacter sp. E15-1]